MTYNRTQKAFDTVMKRYPHVDFLPMSEQSVTTTALTVMLFNCKTHGLQRRTLASSKICWGKELCAECNLSVSNFKTGVTGRKDPALGASRKADSLEELVVRIRERTKHEGSQERNDEDWESLETVMRPISVMKGTSRWRLKAADAENRHQLAGYRSGLILKPIIARFSSEYKELRNLQNGSFD